MNQHTLKYQLLADLLATLEAEEFPIGVGKHLELQQLYSMLPEDVKPEEMKTLLAPIFAKNKQDQEFFYDIFDQSLKHIEAKTWQPKDQPITPILPPKSKWEIITRLLGLVLFLIAALFVYLRFVEKDPATLPSKTINNISIEVKGNTAYSINLLDNDSLKRESFRLITNDSLPNFISFEKGELVGVIHNVGNYQIDSTGYFILKTENEFPKFSKTVKVISKYQKGEIIYALNFFGGKEQVDTSSIDFLEFREHPYPKDLAQLFPNPAPEWITFFQKHKYWIKPILIFLLFALFGAYLNWWAERQQKIIADIQSKNDPPLLWNIQIPNISKIELNEDYFKVLQLMRQRTSDDHFVLNIQKTIDKTIEKGGIVDFQYLPKTRPPEYLLLIDRQSSKNHRAYLYNYMFESFKANEVYIERFFYEGDIRLCWNEYYPNGIKLHDLQQTFRDARLIIVGSGYQLLNPVSGKLAKWTRIFDNWADKAILSPRPTKNWAGRESQLKKKFILLPASVQSLTTMVDKMEAIDPDEVKAKINDEFNEPIEFRGGLIDTLLHYFSEKKSGEPRDESLVHWIAACAIYPTLHWDLTMYLGQELSTLDKNLLTFDNINQLTRLPWFVEGKIPEQARLELLEYLPKDIEMHLRKSLRDLFETIPPPDENSVAFADSRINISLNKYLLEKNDLLKTELNQYARAGADVDVTMLKYLEGEKSPKDFEVDPNLRKYAEGKKPEIEQDRWIKFLSFLVLFLMIGILFYSPNFENCKGSLIQFNDLELCLNTPDDHLIYRAAQIRNYINQNKYEPIDSLEKEAMKQYFLLNLGKRTVTEVGQVQTANYSVEAIMPFVKNDTSILHFYQNLAVDFYNHGVPSYNRFDSLGKSMDEYYQITGDSVNFCMTFRTAIFYDNQISSSGVSEELNSVFGNICPENDTNNEVTVKGSNVHSVSFSNLENASLVGFFIYQENGTWIETNADGKEARFIFKEIKREEWSVHLLDESRDMEIEINLDSGEILFSENGTEKRALYKIIKWSDGLLTIPNTVLSNKVLALKIGGRVYEKGTNKRLDNVEVSFFGNKKITNSRGRFVHNVPDEGSINNFELTYEKDNYKRVDKRYSRNQLMVDENDRGIEFQVEDVFLEKVGIDLTCFEKNKSLYVSYIYRKNYSEAQQTIENVRGCNLGIAQEEEILNWEGELLEIGEKLIVEGDAFFSKGSYSEAFQAYSTVVSFAGGTDLETSSLASKYNLTNRIINNELLLDPRDNQQYSISKLRDGKIWMMENLNFDIPYSFCVNADPKNCDNWGRLYTYNISKNACPEGWHLPSIDEWTYMLKLYGDDAYSQYTNLSKIKFTDQAGGYRGEDKKFLYTGVAAVFWTNSRDAKIKAAIVNIDKERRTISTGSRLMADANSCRCVKD